MQESVSTALHELVQRVGPADVADIGIIALIIYAIVIWVRETASYRILIGLVVLATVYFLARSFNMVMTSQLLHTSLAVLLIVLAIIFQEDLRRGLERVATVGSWHTLRGTTTQHIDVDLLVGVAFSLAARRVGALLVVPGQESLTRHVHGGIELAGRLSKPLLVSLFDPHSAGHDGAAIVQDGQVTHFAVHLPISKNLAQIGLYGTRHAAALGLSEQTDALVIAVSEERGAVSVAERARLRSVQDASELKDHLERFARRRHPLKYDQTWTRLALRDWPAKFSALLAASLAWLLLAYNPNTIQRTFEVPIEYRNIPAQLELADWAPTKTNVTLSGTEPAYRLLEPASLKISVDLNSAEQGTRTIHLTQRHLAVPSNLTVYRFEHSSITLGLSPRQPSAPPSN